MRALGTNIIQCSQQFRQVIGVEEFGLADLARTQAAIELPCLSITDDAVNVGIHILLPIIPETGSDLDEALRPPLYEIVFLGLCDTE